MTIFQPKNLSNLTNLLANFSAFAGIFLQLLSPGSAQAAINKKIAFFSQNILPHELSTQEFPAGRLSRPINEVNAGFTETEPDRVVRAVITAYSSTEDQTDDDPFIAASGKWVYDGMIAANWLRFGTKIKIPALFGDKVFTVDDRMNPRYGFGRLDIWMSAPKAEVKKFGVKRVKVEIYYPSQELAKR